ncbi:MAG: SRPBCC family protein [Deltaproteobacteria bacterium]|nr:SRPBCC family protein [Deltaproteobacteria bacterium]
MSQVPRLELHRSVVTSQTAEAIFSTLCNLAAAPTWLPNCTAINLLDEQSVGLGSRLSYSFRELGYAGSLSCSVVAFIPGQRIAIAFSDARVEASIDFVIDEREGTTMIHHTVMLLPKSLAVRMLARMIRRGLSGRMDAALRGLEQAAMFSA